MNVIEVKVNITGLEKLDRAAKDVNQKYAELRQSLNDFHTALNGIGYEINQPPAGTDG